MDEADRLGEEGQGFRIAMRALDSGRIGISAQAVGLAQGALDDAVAYAKERKQFEKPIAELQTIQNKIADMAVRIRAARWMTWKAAALCDAGRPFTKQASMAKLFSTDASPATNPERMPGTFERFERLESITSRSKPRPSLCAASSPPSGGAASSK